MHADVRQWDQAVSHAVASAAPTRAVPSAAHAIAAATDGNTQTLARRPALSTRSTAAPLTTGATGGSPARATSGLGAATSLPPPPPTPPGAGAGAPPPATAGTAAWRERNLGGPASGASK